MNQWVTFQYVLYIYCSPRTQFDSKYSNENTKPRLPGEAICLVFVRTLVLHFKMNTHLILWYWYFCHLLIVFERKITNKYTRLVRIFVHSFLSSSFDFKETKQQRYLRGPSKKDSFSRKCYQYLWEYVILWIHYKYLTVCITE